MLETINEAVSFLKHQIDFTPDYGIILGSGLAGMVNNIEIAESLPFEIIPGFKTTTVPGHSGKMILGHIGNHPAIAMQGRFHFYEACNMNDIIMPVRVMKLLGVKTLFLSNASGALNPLFEIGDLMIIEDHINLLPNPLIGPNIDSLGPRFPDMSEPYDTTLIRLAEKISKEHRLGLRKGVYVGVTGPTYETPAEYKYLRIIGGDAVGMSTVSEVIAARHMNINCFAISVISDLGLPGKIQKITHNEVLKAVENSEPRLSLLFKNMILSL